MVGSLELVTLVWRLLFTAQVHLLRLMRQAGAASFAELSLPPHKRAGGGRPLSSVVATTPETSPFSHFLWKVAVGVSERVPRLELGLKEQSEAVKKVARDKQRAVLEGVRAVFRHPDVGVVPLPLPLRGAARKPFPTLPGRPFFLPLLLDLLIVRHTHEKHQRAALEQR